MARRTNIKYTKEMRSYIWDRYQAGDSVWSIARSFDRSSSSIHRQLSLTGGIRPPERKRSTHSQRADLMPYSSFAAQVGGPAPLDTLHCFPNCLSLPKICLSASAANTVMSPVNTGMISGNRSDGSVTRVAVRC